jgi:hypothetical protein
MDLERTYGYEGRVDSEALFVGVEDGNEFFKFGGCRWYT